MLSHLFSLFVNGVCCAAASYAMAVEAPTTQPLPLRPESAATHDQDYRADVEAFSEQLNRLGAYPGERAVYRMVQRAKQNRADGEAAFWAARAAMLGWTLAGEIDGPTLLRESAAMGYMPAMRDLAFSMCKGNEGIPMDRVDGVRRLRVIADGGDARALYAMGVAYVEGWGLPGKDLDSGKRFLQRALDSGYYPAASVLAQVYAVSGDQDNATRFFEKAATFGDLNAMRNLVKGAIPSDPDKVRRYLIRGVIWEDPQLTRMFAASLLTEKVGLHRDVPLAFRLLMSAARDGDLVAEAILARARLRGLMMTRRQPERGRRELEWLASGPDETGLAAFLFAQALDSADGIPEDRPRALTLMKRSGDSGFEPARKWLSQNGALPANKSVTTRPATAPVPPEEDHIVMLALAPALEEAATRLLIPSRETPQMSAADQALKDDDEFADWWIHGLYQPMHATIARTLDRAHKIPPDAAALTWSSIAALEGLTHVPSEQEAGVWLKQAAEAGEPVAMAYYGNRLLTGKGGQQDSEQGVKFLELARQKGEPFALVSFGVACINGAPGLEKDYDKGITILSAANRDVVSYNGMLRYLAVAYYQHGDIARFLKTVDVGCIRTCGESYALSMWLFDGQLLAKEAVQRPAMTNDFLFRGALCGNRVVATELAIRLTDDPDQSRLLLRRSALNGDTKAKAILAAALITGAYGIHSDVDRGMSELEQIIAAAPPSASDIMRATEARIGRAEAEWLLGELLIAGKSVPQDRPRGRMLIERAAADQNPAAIKWLATASD